MLRLVIDRTTSEKYWIIFIVFFSITANGHLSINVIKAHSDLMNRHANVIGVSQQLFFTPVAEG
jgi:hypothetical protein